MPLTSLLKATIKLNVFEVVAFQAIFSKGVEDPEVVFSKEGWDRQGQLSGQWPSGQAEDRDRATQSLKNDSPCKLDSGQ